MESERSPAVEKPEIDRRSFLVNSSSVAMAVGLAAGYGTFAAIAARYLYPAESTPTSWMLVTRVDRLKRGDSLSFVTPAGASIAVARQGDTGNVEDFIALSSTCPHLGCQVHWEEPQKRFFCPCHNGVFDPSGKGTGGPPGDAGQSLPRYPLKIVSGLLFLQAPTQLIAFDADHDVPRLA